MNDIVTLPGVLVASAIAVWLVPTAATPTDRKRWTYRFALGLLVLYAVGMAAIGIGEGSASSFFLAVTALFLVFLGWHRLSVAAIVLWIVAVFAGYILYALPVGVVQLVLGLDRLEDPLRSAELTTGILVLGAVLCGAGCGSTIGLAEWVVLRSRLKRAGWWVLATVAGYASAGLLLLIPSVFQPDWMEWAIKLIISGKMHWLAREQPEWPLASWEAGAVTFVMFGVALGIAQWLVLRGRVHHAGWWIVLSAGGWLVPAALSPLMSWPDYVGASWEVPAIVQATGIVWLLRRPITTDQTGLTAPVAPLPS